MQLRLFLLFDCKMGLMSAAAISYAVIYMGLQFVAKCLVVKIFIGSKSGAR